MYITIVLDEDDPLFPLFTEMQAGFRINQHSYTVSIAQRAKTHILIGGRIDEVIPVLVEYITRIDGGETHWSSGLIALQAAINTKRAELYHTMTGRHLDVNT